LVSSTESEFLERVVPLAWDAVSVSAPSGTVTFMFTDIEGSTRLWQDDEAAMRSALSRHDELLRKTVAEHDGVVFSSMGDGLGAAFASASSAVAAALAVQRVLAAEVWSTATPVRVRVGLHTGEAELRDGDYFGTAVNRAARLMAVGHGGQVLVSSQTAGLVGPDVVLVDLGEHRLRDLDLPMRVFQLSGSGFPPLRSLDATPGNLTGQASSFIGRDGQVAELVGLVATHRLVTLTGVGGVGKTRLALQVAAGLVGEFPDGVWLVELAPVGDPEVVPDAVATALGITPQAGLSVTASVARALAGRRLLVVLDNCEHVLGSAGDVAEAVLAGTQTVHVMATSREGLGVGGEQLWPVPSLGVAGAGSEAVELFLARAGEVNPGFTLDAPADVEAVVGLCQRLDGIALAIELAAARMVSMSVQDVLDRLTDRFRLLAGGRRGLERHQTLRQAVAWSYDLLDSDEKEVLGRCSVFAGGFDLPAAVHVCEDFDEYAALDTLDSLVRKSLVTVSVVDGHARYGLLETIRQFAEEQLAATEEVGSVRDAHAAYFAAQVVACFDLWDGPDQPVALDWVEREFANLRAGFRWATDQADLDTAVAIAAHTAALAFSLLRYEPTGWAEELLDAATAADVAQLPRLYATASGCAFTGRPEVAVGYAQAATAIQANPRYDPFEPYWSSIYEASALAYTGRVDRFLEISADLAAQPGTAHVLGLGGLVSILPVVGRGKEARAMAEETLSAAIVHGNPFFIAFAYLGCGRAFTDTDPERALRAAHIGLEYCRQHRIRFWEAATTYVAAGLEALHGDLDQALALFDTAIDIYQRGGDQAGLVMTLAELAVFFDRIQQAQVAATLFGAISRSTFIAMAPAVPDVEHLRSVLGETLFDECAAAGAAMEAGDDVRYARSQIRLAQRQTTDPSTGDA
jgi:predicted ATPase/class 3 adenylate cyclase